MKAKYLVSVLDILYKKYGIKFNINDTMRQASKKIDEFNTFKDMPKTNGSHLATNIIQFLDERDRIKKQKGEK